MSTLIWKLRQWGRVLGGAGVAGLGALLLALLIQLTQVATLNTTAAEQRTRLATLEAAARTAEVLPAAPVNPLAGLPPTGEAARLIGELERLARAHGLALPRGQYSVSSVDVANIQHWRLVLPLEADYPTLHAFLAAALERQSSLSLDELKLTRERIESDKLQGEIRLSLFVEAAR